MPLPLMTTRRWMVVMAIAALGAWRVDHALFAALFWGAPLLGSFLGIVIADGRRRRSLGGVLGAAITSACVFFTNLFVYQKYTFVTMVQAPKEPFTEAMAGAVLGSFVGIAALLDYRRSLSWLWGAPALIRTELFKKRHGTGKNLGSNTPPAIPGFSSSPTRRSYSE